MLLQSIEIIVQCILGGGVIWLAWEANKVAKYQLKKENLKIFKPVYSKITKSLGLVMEHGNVDDEALLQFDL